MKKILKTYWAYLLLFLTAIPGIASAQAQPGGITNPIEADNLNVLIINIVKWMTGITAILALMGLVYGGIMIILGFSDEGNVQQGKNIVKWSVIGLAIVVLSYSIILTVVNGILGGVVGGNIR